MAGEAWAGYIPNPASHQINFPLFIHLLSALVRIHLLTVRIAGEAWAGGERLGRAVFPSSDWAARQAQTVVAGEGGACSLPEVGGGVRCPAHGARPVHLIITMIKGIRTSRFSIKNSLSLEVRKLFWRGHVLLRHSLELLSDHRDLVPRRARI